MVIYNCVSDLYPQIIWNYDKKGKLTKDAYDSSDAICAGLGFMYKENLWER